jgi:DNA-3-methyladenine glycosylase I
MTRTVAHDRRQRCAWAQGDDALMARYHDEEWGVPQRDPRMLWEMLVLEGFQAGLSWRTVLHKREAFRCAFAGFDPAAVARFGPKQVERLLADPGIVRSRAKIDSAIRGARRYLDMRERGCDFAPWAWSFVDGKPIQNAWDHVSQVPAETPLSREVSKALKAEGFNFSGPVIVYAWMQATGLVNDHLTGCFRHGEVRSMADAR